MKQRCGAYSRKTHTRKMCASTQTKRRPCDWNPQEGVHAEDLRVRFSTKLGELESLPNISSHDNRCHHKALRKEGSHAKIARRSRGGARARSSAIRAGSAQLVCLMTGSNRWRHGELKVGTRSSTRTMRMCARSSVFIIYLAPSTNSPLSQDHTREEG